ncbi:MAG: PDDEXK nuclease domain-containing protein, partial [Acidobacteria bacterium]|nr:PDDEXK nuclease domain-containing protein [Acidobacteriota bacterium]
MTIELKTKQQPISAVEPGDSEFFQSIAEFIQSARRSLERDVNTTMVLTYFEIGRRIIEKEQHGEKRAQYGKKILQGLSAYLTAKLGKGFSVDNLKLMRRFYVVYANRWIRKLPVIKSVAPIGEPLVPQSTPGFSSKISWKHYILLMRIANPDERLFYEVEIAGNGWSFSEFQRQYDSSLYERLALSRNKKKIRELAAKGQIVNEPQDLFKDPYVLEFTGLAEKAEYTETELEQKLIDHLQQFLLELGKGFAF